MGITLPEEGEITDRIASMLDDSDPVRDEQGNLVAQPSSQPPPPPEPQAQAGDPDSQDPATVAPAEDPNAEEGADPAAAAQEEAAIRTTAELAEAFGVAEEQLFSQIHLNDPSTGREIPLAEVVRAYSDIPVAARNLAGLQQEQARLEQERGQYKSEHEGRIQELVASVEQINTLIEGEEKVDLAALERDDPQAAQARRLRKLEMESARQAGLEALRKQARERQAEEQRSYETWVRGQTDALFSKVPELRDTEKRLSAHAGIADALKQVGFGEDELPRVNDHRVLLLAHKAAQYDRAKGKGALLAARVRKTPKLVSPDAARTAATNDPAVLRHRAAMKNLREHGDDRSAAAAIEGLL